MDAQELVCLRKTIGKTQVELGRLLGVSTSAVRAYEQGWRNVPCHVERHLLFLASRKLEDRAKQPCWVIKNCPDEVRERCPAWEFHAGTFCWFVNGTLCHGDHLEDWSTKMESCRKCPAFRCGEPSSEEHAIR